MHLNFIIVFLGLSMFLIYFCKSKNLFVDYKLEKHKRYSTHQKSYSIGGLLLIFYMIYNFGYISKNYLLLIFLISIFTLGLLSDLKRLNSVSLRFFLQIIIIFFSIAFLNIEINETRIELFDKILQNKVINIFFVIFCMMVLINGGNFIDGLNGLLLTYFLVVFLIISLNFSDFHFVDKEFLINLIIVLSIILVLNILGFLYMGDSGAYLLSFIAGYYLIEFSSNNIAISPYFIIVLLWYPCFELLFSMIRRSSKDIKTYKPDTLHLHQMIYVFFKKKLNTNNNRIFHLYSSIIINFYNAIVFYIAINFIYRSEILISIIILNIVVYLIIYSFLKNKKFS